MSCSRRCCRFAFVRTIHFFRLFCLLQPSRTIDYCLRRSLQAIICSSEGFLGNAGAHHNQAGIRSSGSSRLSGIETGILSARRCFGSRSWKCGMSAMAAVVEEAGGLKTCVQESLEAKCNLLDDFASTRDCCTDGCLSDDSLTKDNDSYYTHVDGEMPHFCTEKLQDEELLRVWQAMTRKNEVPHLVKTLIYKLKALEEEMGESLSHRGPRGRIQCWLPRQHDCMCDKLETGSLWHGIKFWVYMHPKDFLRKNNTGKLLWQVFGADSVHLCLYGIEEHEVSMWNAFSQAGENPVWCLYPERDNIPCHVHELLFPETIIATSNKLKNEDNFVCHFILMDGTWSNSKAMISRLQDRARLLWSGSELPCVSLSPTTLSVMHNLSTA